MKEITQITSQKNDDRLNVFLDGTFAFGVEYATAVKFSLKVGKMLSNEEIDAILAEEGNVYAYNKALKYAVKKTVSQKQLEEYLQKKGYSGESINLAVKKLVSYGYVNDVEYARAYVSTYSMRGSKRLEAELRNAGIAEEIIAFELGKRSDDEACGECIKKYKRTRRDTDRKKLVNYLLYRGFSYDVISECISRSEDDEDNFT